MKQRRILATPVIVICVAACLLAGCGSSGTHKAANAPTTTSVASTTTAPVTALHGTVIVAATPDAAPVVAIVDQAMAAAEPGVHLRVLTVPADVSATTIRSEGADLVVSSAPTALEALSGAGVTYQPVVFIRTKLRLVVAPTDPHAIKTVSDLSRPGIRVVLVNANTLTGQASERALGANGVSVTTLPAVATPQAAVAAIDAGRADASLLEIPDVDAAGSHVRAFDLPDQENVITQFSYALVRRATTGSIGPLVQQVAADLSAGPVSDALVAANWLLPAATAPTGSDTAGSG